jgi:hypothetical protein
VSRISSSLLRILTKTGFAVFAYVSVALFTLTLSINLIALWNSLSSAPPVIDYQQANMSKARKISYQDLSETYGKVNRTIFNKKTHVVFSTPQEFFADAGVNSFDNLKFDEVLLLPTSPCLVNGRRLTNKEIAAIVQPLP